MPSSSQTEPYNAVTPSLEPPLLSGAATTWGDGTYHHRESVRIAPRPPDAPFAKTAFYVACTVTAFMLLVLAGIVLNYR